MKVKRLYVSYVNKYCCMFNSVRDFKLHKLTKIQRWKHCDQLSKN